MGKAALFFLAWLLASPAWAGQVVKVGGYDFAPFIEPGPDGKPGGLTLRLIELINARQDRFTFQFVPTSPNRRYKDFEEKRFDAIFFESPDWGWLEKKLPVEASRVFLDGGEVYIAQAQPGRAKDYFHDLAGKRMVGILGYHYGFAGFDSDPQRLAARWSMALVKDNGASIDMILKDRGDVAVVTDAFLKRRMRENPSMATRLLISDRYDQRYAHRVLMRKGGPVPASEMDAILDAMEIDGTLARLWREAGIRD